MRVLITGAAGFIGSHLADALHARGDDVYGVDNFTTGQASNVGGWQCDPGDIEADPLVMLDPTDVIVHCAASYKDPVAWHEDLRTNAQGTARIADVARQSGAKLVYFQTALPPISSYAISKIAGEQYIALSGVPALIFRLANIYGPRNLSGPIPTFYKRLTAEERCTVTDTARDMVYIDDLVRLVVAAIDKDVTGKYDVCTGTHTAIADLYDYVLDAVLPGEDRDSFKFSFLPAVIPADADDVKQMELNPTKAVREFDWYEHVPLDEGIRRAVAWYREHGVGETYTHLKIGAKA